MRKELKCNFVEDEDEEEEEEEDDGSRCRIQ